MLHIGTPHLSSLTSPLNLAAIALLAVGLWRAVAGRAPAQPVRTRVLVPVTGLAAVGWLGTPTAVVFAHRFTHAAAFAQSLTRLRAKTATSAASRRGGP